MVQLTSFSGIFERNFERSLPQPARSTVHKLARTVVKKSKDSSTLDKQLEYAHAALHMQLYERYGAERCSQFIKQAHDALDILVAPRRDAAPMEGDASGFTTMQRPSAV